MCNVFTTLLLVLVCLLNQVAWQTVRPEQRDDVARIAAARPAAECVFLRTSDTGQLPKIAEALLAAYVVPETMRSPVHAMAAGSESLGRAPRTTLQSLDIRLQV